MQIQKFTKFFGFVEANEIYSAKLFFISEFEFKDLNITVEKFWI